jgi:hypothetical protein
MRAQDSRLGRSGRSVLAREVRGGRNRPRGVDIGELDEGVPETSDDALIGPVGMDHGQQ